MRCGTNCQYLECCIPDFLYPSGTLVEGSELKKLLSTLSDQSSSRSVSQSRRRVLSPARAERGLRALRPQSAPHEGVRAPASICSTPLSCVASDEAATPSEKRDAVLDTARTDLGGFQSLSRTSQAPEEVANHLKPMAGRVHRPRCKLTAGRTKGSATCGVPV